jgi:4-amino-4-deoxy-L-arabinose transferase-like glycosyltransferase
MEAVEPSPRRQAWIVGGITLLGLALRLWGLSDESFWQDEAWSWWMVQGGLGDTVYRTVDWDLHPPLYYLILGPWSRLGDSEFWLRLPSVLFGAASIPLLFRIGKRLLGWNAGVGACLLMALSANTTYFSQEARSYSLLTLEVLVAANLVESEIRTRTLLLGIVLGLIALTHYVGGFFALIIAAWLLWRREKRTLIISGSVAAALFAPWSPFFARQIARADSGFWLPAPTPREVWSCLLEFAQFPHYLPSWGVRLAGIALLVAVAGGWWWKRRDRAGRIALLWAAGPIAISLILSLRLNVFYARSLAYVLPAWFLLAACWPRRFFMPVTAIVALAFIGGQVALRTKVQKEDWRSAVAFTEQRPDIAIAFWPGDLRAPGDYYLRSRPKRTEIYSLPPDGYAAGTYQREQLDYLVGRMRYWTSRPAHVWLFTRHGRKHVGAADFARFKSGFFPTGIQATCEGVLVELWERERLFRHEDD